MVAPAFGSQPLGQSVPPPAPPLQKPTAAFVLSLIGGIFILLWGALIAVIGASFGPIGRGVAYLGGIESLLGILVIGFGVLLYVMPQNHVAFGILVLVFSIASLIGLGGLLIGFILGLIGGILGIVHKPTPEFPTVVYVQPQRVCTKCGRAVNPEVKFCPFCGNPLG